MLDHYTQAQRSRQFANQRRAAKAATIKTCTGKAQAELEERLQAATAESERYDNEHRMFGGRIGGTDSVRALNYGIIDGLKALLPDPWEGVELDDAELPDLPF
jgi:hypothetical protein